MWHYPRTFGDVPPAKADTDTLPTLTQGVPHEARVLRLTLEVSVTSPLPFCL